MTPPKTPQEREDDEHKIDEAIRRMDQALPKLKERCESGDSPTKGLPIGRFQRVQRAIKQMAEDSLLTPSGEDITLPEPRLSKINGKQTAG